MKSEPLFDKADAGALGATEKPAKVKKPKVPKPPVDPNEHISQRAFIGGLAKDITPTDVEGRFKSFGKLTDVYLAKDVDGSCRGFGYVTLDTTRKDWSKCVTLFNGAKWKGHVLKIEEANKDWQTKRQEDVEKQVKIEKKEKDALVKKFKRQPARHAEDMSLITDKNMDGKRGWKRGRFGRPVITLKMDKMTYDPSHYKNNVEKLFNLQAKPLPLSALIYQIDENEPIPKGKHLSSEVALAAFLPKTAAATTATSTTTHTKKETTSTKSKDTTSSLSSTSLEESNAVHTSDDRAMMASVLAGLDMSPRAMSLDGSDFEDDDDMRGSYAEEFGGPLKDTTADDMFGDLDLAPVEVVPKSKRDSRPEDLFGDDDDEEEDQSSRPSLDFLEDEEDDGEGEYDEDQEEEEEEEDDEDEGEYEEDQDEEEEEFEEEEEEGDEDMDEDTLQAIAQLQGKGSSSSGGLFDSDEDEPEEPKDASSKFAEESNIARLKAQEAREAELEATRGKQQQLIASQLANLDSRDKKEGHVVFDDSDDYDSEDYEKMETDHNKKMARLNKPAKSIFDSDSGSDEEEEQEKVSTKTKKGVKEMFASDDEEGEEDLGAFGEKNLIKEQFEGPGGKALFQMQTRIGTSDSRFQLTKDFLDDRIRAEDDQDFVAHQDRLRDDEMTTSGDGATEIVLDEDRQADSNVSAEKMQAMSVLRAMFGESAVRSKKKEEDSARKAMGGVGFTTGLTVRYDPDSAPPPPPPATTTKDVEDPDSKLTVFDSESDSESASKPASSKLAHGFESESEDEEMEDIEEKAPKTTAAEKPAKKSVGFSFAFDAEALDKDEDDTKVAPSSVVKDLDTSTKFQVATDLKSLFAPAAGSFKMFGGDDEEDEDEDKENDDDRDVEDDSSYLGEDRSQEQEESILTSYSQGSRTIFGSTPGQQPLSHSGSMFFFHFKEPSLLKRSNFKTTNKVFMRTDTMEEVTAHWEKTRHTMTQEFKRKHKSASRNKARATKRFKSNQHGDGHGG